MTTSNMTLLDDIWSMDHHTKNDDFWSDIQSYPKWLRICLTYSRMSRRITIRPNLDSYILEMTIHLFRKKFLTGGFKSRRQRYFLEFITWYILWKWKNDHFWSEIQSIPESVRMSLAYLWMLRRIPIRPILGTKILETTICRSRKKCLTGEFS